MSALSKFTIYNLQFTIKLFLILLAFIFTFYILHFTLLKPAFAQTSTPSAVQSTVYSLPSTVQPTSPIYTDLLVNNMFHTFSCLAVGSSIIGQPCLTYQVTKNAQGVIQSIPVLSQTNLSGGALGATTSLIGMLYINPPVRTADYLASLGEQFGVVKEARAQVGGSGAAVLSPILTLWQVSRNISYVIMIIIFVIIGLMVMFRQRINPQTVITAQAALPGLVIGLILITFSYFLAGLISDMAFVGTNVVGYYFQAAQKGGDLSQNLTQVTTDQNVLTIFSKFVGIIDSGDATHALEIVFNSVGPEVQNFMRFAAGLMAFQFGNQAGHVFPYVGELAGIIVGVLGSVVTAAAAPQVLGQVLAWVSMVVLIYSMLKLLLRLINSYLTIIFLTLTAPFHFLAASLPGRQGIATGWILNMLANILIFPAILAVFYFVAFLLGPSKGHFDPFKITDVKIIDSATFPLFGGLDTSFITIILALGALIASPAIPDIIVRMVGRAGQAGQLLGQELSGNIRGGQGYSNQGQQIGQIGTRIGQEYQTFRGGSIKKSPAGQLAGKTFLGRPITLPKWLKER